MTEYNERPFAEIEIHEANALQERLLVLQANFDGWGESYNQVLWVELFNDMKSFEKILCNFEILTFLYGYMATTALYAMMYKDALIYAGAGESICVSIEDNEGVRYNQLILCDIAATVRDYKKAVHYYKLVHPAASRETNAKLEDLTKQAAKTHEPLISMEPKALPSSYKYINTDIGTKERGIRVQMKGLHIGRAEAKRNIQGYQQTTNEHGK